MMKYFSIILLTVALALASCSKNSTNPTDNNNTNTGTNAAVVNSNKGNLTFKIGLGLFDRLYGTTDMVFSSYVSDDNQQTAGYSMVISFRGNGIASYNLDDLDNGITILKNYVVYTSIPGSGKINITKYGAVGQTIEGNFTAQFESVTGGETFTVTSASFKASRLADDDDDGDPDDDLSYSSMEIKLTTTAGGSLDFFDDKLDGNASYNAEYGMLAIAVYHLDNDDEFMATGISIYGTDIENKHNQTLVFEGDTEMSLLFTYEGMPYKFIGTAVITHFAQGIGDKFEVTGSGEFYSLIDGEKVGDIQNFKIKVTRFS